MFLPRARRTAAAAVLLASVPLAAQADPITFVALVAPYIGGTVAAFIASNALVLGLIAVQVAGAAIGRRKARSQAARARAEANSRLEDRSITALQSVPPWRVIYGRCIVGGDIVAIFTSDGTGYRENGNTYTKPDALKHLVIVLAAHEVQAINEVYVDGVALGALDGSGWVTSGDFYTAGWPDTRSVTVGAGTFLDVPEAVVTILQGYYTTGVGVDQVFVSVTPTLSVGNTRITNPDPTNSITVDYTIAHDSGSKASVRVSKHLGSASQTVDTYLNGVVPSQWTSNHRLRGLAYVVVTLDLQEPRFQGGPPMLTFDVSGKLVLDPRTAATAWSANPALIVRDWLASEWGYEVDAADVDDAACNAAANACEVRQLGAVHAHAATCTASAADDTVTFASDMWFGLGDGMRFTTTGTLPGGLSLATTYYAIPLTDRRTFQLATSRANALAGTVRNITGAGTGTHTGTWYDYDTYTCHGAFSAADSREAVLEDLVESMAGFASYGASWLINAGAWTASVMSLTDDDLDGQIEIVQAGAGMDALFNGVHGSYIAVGKATPTDFDPYQNATFVTADDGRELWQDVALPFTDNKVRAANLARIFVERNRDGLVIMYPAKLKAWPLQVGDRVSVTSAEYGFSAKTFRVTDWQFGTSTAVQLTLQEDIAAIYDIADAVSADPAPNTDLPDPWTVVALTSLTALSDATTVLKSGTSAIVPRVLVTWDAVADSYVADGSGRIEILWRRPGGPWQQINVPGDSTSVYIVGANDGDRIVIEARARNSLGVAGPSAFLSHTVQGPAKLAQVLSATNASVGITGRSGTGSNAFSRTVRWTNVCTLVFTPEYSGDAIVAVSARVDFAGLGSISTDYINCIVDSKVDLNENDAEDAGEEFGSIDYRQPWTGTYPAAAPSGDAIKAAKTISVTAGVTYTLGWFCQILDPTNTTTLTQAELTVTLL